MSDQRGPATPLESSPAALRDTRWLAGAIWAVSLLALLVTSAMGMGQAVGTFDFTALSLLAYSDLGHGEPNRELAVSAALIITAGIALVLVVAWWAFARATQGLIAALSDSSDSRDDSPVRGIWLIEGSGRSPLSDLLTFLGFAWALIVLRPMVITAIQVFTS